jgi:RHS repeat-associated protein
VESGNDYFEARYYSSAIARFLSADEAFADQHPADPQSWNLYMYAGNNPLGFVDRTGRGKAGDIAWGVVSGTGLFLYNSTPIPGAVTGVKMLAHFAANPSAAIAESNAQGEHDRAAIANTMKALGSSQGRAALAKAAGDAWNGQTLVQKTQVITQLTLGVGVAVVGGVAGSARSVGASSEALAARVTEIHGALDPIAQTMRTTAGAGTEEGISIFAGGKRDLIPAQRALLVPGEIAAKLPGADAEITIMSAAAKNGLNLTDLRVTRPICSDCQSAIEGSGGRLTSDRSATWRK